VNRPLDAASPPHDNLAVPPEFLVVTRPPLSETAAPRASRLLGLPAYETRLFLRHPLPAILQVADTRARADDLARTCVGAGVDVETVAVTDLTSLPPPGFVRAVGLGDEVLSFSDGEGRVDLRWSDLRALIVIEYDVRWIAPVGYDFVHHHGGAVTESRQAAELVAVVGGATRRLRLAPFGLDYAGLGPLKKPGVLENWITLLAEIRRRAPALLFDDAMAKSRPRDTLVDGRDLESHFAGAGDVTRAIVCGCGEFYLGLRAHQAIAGTWPTRHESVPPEPPRPTGPPSTPPSLQTEETFRPGATLGPYALWSVLCIVACVFAYDFLPAGTATRPLVVALAVLFGPVAFLAQLARWTLGGVTVDPRSGLRLSAGRLIPWSEMAGVDEAGVRFVFDSAPARGLMEVIRTVGERTTSRTAVLHLFAIAVLGLVMLALWLVGAVLVPVMLLLSPFQHRVEVRLKSGRRIAWRDLIGEARFVRRVRNVLRDRA